MNNQIYHSRRVWKHAQKGLLLGVALVTASCTPFQEQAQRSDGALDFVAAIVGHPRRNVFPVERLPARNGGEIVTAHAEMLSGSVYVSGFVEKSRGYSSFTGGHVDVRVLGPDGRLVSTLATAHTPREIPPNYRGRVGRAQFAARLKTLPPAGSTIRVAYCQRPVEECAAETEMQCLDRCHEGPALKT